MVKWKYGRSIRAARHPRLWVHLPARTRGQKREPPVPTPNQPTTRTYHSQRTGVTATVSPSGREGWVVWQPASSGAAPTVLSQFDLAAHLARHGFEPVAPCDFCAEAGHQPSATVACPVCGHLAWGEEASLPADTRHAPPVHPFVAWDGSDTCRSCCLPASDPIHDWLAPTECGLAGIEEWREGWRKQGREDIGTGRDQTEELRGKAAILPYTEGRGQGPTVEQRLVAAEEDEQEEADAMRPFIAVYCDLPADSPLWDAARLAIRDAIRALPPLFQLEADAEADTDWL